MVSRIALICCALLAFGCKRRPPRDLPRPPVHDTFDLDLDHNGRVDDSERLEARKQRLAQTLSTVDSDHDGKVSVEELARTQVFFLRFDDPRAVDRDHDGTISVDELESAIDARHQAMRARWEHEIHQ